MDLMINERYDLPEFDPSQDIEEALESETQEIETLLEDSDDLCFKMEYLSSLMDESIEHGVSKGLVLSAESILEDSLTKDYSIESYTTTPSRINFDIAMEGLISGIFKVIGKIVEVIFKLLGKTLTMIGRVMVWMAGGGRSSSSSGSSSSGGGSSSSSSDSDDSVTVNDKDGKKVRIKILSDEIEAITNIKSSFKSNAAKEITKILERHKISGLTNEKIKSNLEDGDKLKRLKNDVSEFKEKLSPIVVGYRDVKEKNVKDCYEDYNKAIVEYVESVKILRGHIEMLIKEMDAGKSSANTKIGDILFGRSMASATASGLGEGTVTDSKKKIDANIAKYDESLKKDMIDSITSTYTFCNKGIKGIFKDVNIGNKPTVSIVNYTEQLKVISESIINQTVNKDVNIHIETILKLKDDFAEVMNKSNKSLNTEIRSLRKAKQDSVNALNDYNKKITKETGGNKEKDSKETYKSKQEAIKYRKDTVKRVVDLQRNKANEISRHGLGLAKIAKVTTDKILGNRREASSIKKTIVGTLSSLAKT